MRFNREKVSDEIPTSSMADIAFLLIIYFMVTTTFAATRGLDWALPQEDDSPPQIEKEEAVLIEIRPSGAIVVDLKPMALGDILGYLEPKLERNPLKPVIIRPDANAPYGMMIQVFDELRLGGRTLEEYNQDETPRVEVKNITIPTQREIDAFWY